MDNGSKRLKIWEQPTKILVLESWARNGLKTALIAEKMGIARSTLYEWIRESPKIRDVLDQGGAFAIAFAEKMLMKKISEGDITAIIFFLKSRRGSVYNRSRNDAQEEIEDENADLSNEIQDALEGKEPKEARSEEAKERLNLLLDGMEAMLDKEEEEERLALAEKEREAVLGTEPAPAEFPMQEPEQVAVQDITFVPVSAPIHEPVKTVAAALKPRPASPSCQLPRRRKFIR